MESESDSELVGLPSAPPVMITYDRALLFSAFLPFSALAAFLFSFASSASSRFRASSFAFKIRSATPLPLVMRSSGTSTLRLSFDPPPSAN